MLFNAGTGIVVVIPPIVVTILKILGIGIAGATIGWFLHDWLSKQSETPGVTLDTYVWSVTDRWEVDIKNMANYLRSITEALTWSKEYYGRVAANMIGPYLNYSDLTPYEAAIMRDIAYDIYSYYDQVVIQGLKNFANELAYFHRERLTGDLDDYDVRLANGLSFKDLSSDILPVYTCNNGRFKAWIFGQVKFAPATPYVGTVTVTFRNVLTNSSTTITKSSEDWGVFSGPEGIYEITCSASTRIAMENLLIISHSVNLSPEYMAKFRGVGSDALYSAKFLTVYKQGNIIKYINLDSVWSAVENIVNHLDLIYDTAWNSARIKHQTCRMAGITDPTRINECVLPPPTVVMPTTEDMYKMFGDKFDEWLAYYLAYLQSVNETFRQMRADFTGMISQLNMTFADVREKLMNVIIRLPNGSVWAELETLIPLWISKAQEFQANASNILQGMMGAIAVFKNGTVRYIEIPPGYQIQPGTIVTPSGQVPSLVLQNWAAGLNPAYSPGNYTQPEFVQRADETIQVALQLFLVILPLILIVAVVRMITDIGGRR